MADPAHAPCFCLCWLDGVRSEPVKGWDGIQFVASTSLNAGAPKKRAPRLSISAPPARDLGHGNYLIPARVGTPPE